MGFQQLPPLSFYNIHTIKLLDSEWVIRYTQKCRKLITVEDHSVIGGLGEAVASVLCGRSGFEFRKLGVQDRFGQSATPAELLHEYGIDCESIVNAVKE